MALACAGALKAGSVAANRGNVEAKRLVAGFVVLGQLWFPLCGLWRRVSTRRKSLGIVTAGRLTTRVTGAARRENRTQPDGGNDKEICAHCR